MSPPTHGSSTHSYGRRTYRMSAEDEAKIRELERLREEYLKRKREEGEKERERAAVEAHVAGVKDLELYGTHNAEQHNTSNFELIHFPDPPLIVRRGQPFNICVRFQRQYDLTLDSIELQFTIGSNPRAIKGTLIRLPIEKKKSFTMPSKEWDVRLHHEESQIMHLSIQISCKAAVGVWNLSIISSHPNAPVPREYKVGKAIYILFNPWCKEDAVFMEDEKRREEYVLNESGKLFTGSATKQRSRRWIYGQFSAAVLPASMAILEKSSLDDIGRGSPVKVVRAISAMLNSENDDGVLEGKWTKPYDNGVAPYQWTGSTDILERYLRSGFKPVRYGQCWVFAGLFTTVCRTLGIPCRPVTNYVSAHDTDDTLTIDRHFTFDGDKLDDDDSIWNFHVWNDCWMTRPDLPPAYGGWQAVDSTPQETSEGLIGIYQTGPASLHAVKRGEVGYLYDSPFVFSEVNADVIHWQRDRTQRIGWKKLETKKYHVGRMIVTKMAGVDDYEGDEDKEDITNQYKSTEGSSEERLSIRNAATHGNYAAVFDLPPPGTEDVFFDLIEIDKVMIGKPFSVVVHVENRSNESRKITAALTADSVFYTGIKAHTIKHDVQKFVLAPGQKEVLALKITADEYYEKLVDYSMMKIYAVATVKETKQTWTEEDDFAVEKPRLKLEISQPLKVGRGFDLSITLKNPLLRPLRECSFVVEGPGLAEPQHSDFRDIRPEETIKHHLWFMPKRTGKRNIFVVFNSEELIDVQGSLEVKVV